ncbi:MAG: AMP-binding protein [Lachnospiraceae bacterium]|nr:AMP-binding protein [Lachnospiraceae bacterium]
MFKNFNQNIALIDENQNEFTYEQLFSVSEELFNNIGKRTLVFSICKNTIESVIGYVTFINNKIVPLMLPNKLDKEQLVLLLDTYKPEYIWTPIERIDDFNDFQKIYSWKNYTLLKTDNPTVPLFDELALLLTTSGSTGSPKLVRQSYKNLISNTEAIVEYLNISSTERAITTLPMNYTYGLSILNTHLYVGATILLTDKAIIKKEFWDFFKETNATSFGGVPYTYEMLKKIKFFNMQLPSLRYMTQAGGKLTPELHKEFAEFALDNNVKFIVMYGQTEATARMAYLPSEKALEKYGSMGIAIPNGRFDLIDVDGNVINEPDTVGELVYYGDNVTLGYAEKYNDLSLGDERNGCLQTGDMAKQDSDGYYYIVGRKKRFLKLFGNRVNLDETERLIKQAFNNIECACAGIDDKMYIYITDEKYSSDIKDYVSSKTHLNKSAFDIRIIDEIPKNDSGKTIYNQLK